DVTIFGVANFSFGLTIIIPSATAIAGWPGFFNKISCVGCHAPVVAVGTYLGINIKIIYQSKLVGNRVFIGRYFVAKNTKRSISIAFGDIAENLVVSAVFFYDV